MRRARAIYVLMFGVMAPFGWLCLSTDWASDSQGTILAVGSGLTGAILAWTLLQGHRAGKLLPNRCGNCGAAMAALRTGQLVARDGTPDRGGRRWHCRGCGQLAS